jgi:hypothetical protein
VSVVFGTEIATVTIFVLFFGLVAILLIVALCWRITFTLYPDRLEYRWWGATECLLFSEAGIIFNPYRARAYLTRNGVVWMSLAGISRNLLLDFFAALPSSVKVSQIAVTGFSGGKISEPKEDAFTKSAMAATAFHYLNDQSLARTLIARQILINLSQRDPGYMPSPAQLAQIRKWKIWMFKEHAESMTSQSHFLGQESIALAVKIREWKKWLACEYGEEIEAYAYHLEQAFVRMALYYIVLPGVLLSAWGVFDNSGAIYFCVVVAAMVSICVLSSRFGLLLRHRSIARAVRRWRANDDGVNSFGTAPQNQNKSEGEI